MRVGFHNALWAAPLGGLAVVATAYGVSKTAKLWIQWAASGMTHPMGVLIGLAFFCAYIAALWLTRPKNPDAETGDRSTHHGSGHNIKSVGSMQIVNNNFSFSGVIREIIERHTHHKELTTAIAPTASLEVVMNPAEKRRQETERRALINRCRDIAHAYTERSLNDGFRAFLERHRDYSSIRRHLSEDFMIMLHKQRTFYVAADGAGYSVLVQAFLNELDRLESELD
jgi:predicted CopG family antitoxin